MGTDKPLQVWLGWDSREPVAAEVASHSILKRTQTPVDIKYLKHRELRKQGMFNRPWLVGEQMTDLLDNRPFSTEFSHTRFLVPALMGYKGWALFMDSDMLVLSDIAKLFDLFDDKYAVMCVKHNHKPNPQEIKMDGRVQADYRRKNWSSFVAFNCSHGSNKVLTEERVNFMKGGDLHSFSWLADYEIGALPFSYNYIAGVSPKLDAHTGNRPDVLHFTSGGPWFDECQNVPYAQLWLDEYEDWQQHGGTISEVRTMKYDSMEDRAR